ncbi:hypothetical protein E3P77_01420 [Wallemia ichthyophaga]|nr:hypothetical protein E3P77_01420 [Wallemia ichthyophaga]
MDDLTNRPHNLKHEDDDDVQIRSDINLKRKERENDDDEVQVVSEPDPMMESLKKLLSKSTLYSKILQKKMSDPSQPPPPKEKEEVNESDTKPDPKPQSRAVRVDDKSIAPPAAPSVPSPEKRKSSRPNAGINAQMEKNKREAEMRREAIEARNKRSLRSQRKKDELDKKTRGTARKAKDKPRIEFSDSEEEQSKDKNNKKEEILYRDDLESDNAQSDYDQQEREDSEDDEYDDKPKHSKVVVSSSEEEEDEEDNDQDLPHYPGQPALVSGTELRDFQKNGVEWLSTLDSNGFSGILADEMGLGKTLQTITFLAKLMEDGSKGPFLIICPLSVVKNWINEFAKFTPKLQPVMYHGDAKKRAAIRQEMKTRGFFNPKLKNKWALQPRIICTTYEMAIRDARTFRRIEWRYIVVDEGHRLRNIETKLLKELKTFVSANRLIITGTPLQNNLKELWSLLNFCLPQLFDDLESFNTLFDFNRVNSDENGNSEERQNETVQLMSTLHEILQPFLLRRLKSDVAKGLPPKKEYVLYAPLTQKQKSVYDAILNRQIRSAISDLKTHGDIDGEGMRKEEKGDEVLAPRASKYRKKHANNDDMKIDDSKSDSENLSPTNNASDGNNKSISAYFTKPKSQAKTNDDDKSKIIVIEDSDDDDIKSQSAKKKEKNADDTIKTVENGKDDKMEDDDFEAMLIKEAEDHRLREEVANGKRKSLQAARDAAKKEMGNMKFENLVMQARKICAHPYIFHWDVNEENEKTVGRDLVNASGKMMLCMRLLEELKSRGHKTLIFSQFVTLLDILEGELKALIEHRFSLSADYLVDGLGWNICRLDGSTSQEERELQIDLFNNQSDDDPDAPKVFLLSTRAGGLGINLVGADSIIFYDSDWNPQVDIQAMDRVHRIGQTKPVLIFRLVTKNSVEQKMMTTAKGKRKLESMVISQGHYKQDNSGKKVNTTHERLTKALDELDITNVRTATDDEKLISDEEMNQLLDRSDEAMKREQGWTHGKGASDIAQVMGLANESNGDDNIKMNDLDDQSAQESSNLPSNVASAEPSRAVSENTESHK